MILVIDTNLLLSHPELDGQQWDEVVQAIADDVLTVVIPHVVADELTARVRAKRAETKPVRPKGKGYHRIPARISSAVDAAYTAANEQIERWVQSYDAHRVLTEAGFTIRPAPVAAHEDLGWRAANRRRPFDDDGNGYRDTLHWYTVLELLRENPGEHVVLLSGDKKAYWDGNSPHPDIVAEYEPLLADGATFTLGKGLSDISIPSKYTKAEEPVTLTDEERDEIVAELFADGALRAPDLDPDQPDGVEITDPKRPTVIFARARELTTRGTAYQVRIRLNGHITLDWVDWIDDPADPSLRGDFDITVWYVRDANGMELNRADVQRAPIEPSPRRTSSRSGYPGNAAWEALKGTRVSDVDTSSLARDSVANLLRNIGHLPIAEITASRLRNEWMADMMRASHMAAAAEGAMAAVAEQAARGLGAQGAMAAAAEQAARGLGAQGAMAAVAEQAARGLGAQGAMAAAAEQAARGLCAQGAVANAAGRLARGEDFGPEEAPTEEAVTGAQDQQGSPEANELRN
ncbi:PIN domain-containing protein [Curtobacterium sp. L3-7]|uniref:PIN domain-containing protein n=1 Tax=Curtobacterium sp. L3-7 TaxID=3138787 RepID=UPI003B52F853